MDHHIQRANRRAFETIAAEKRVWDQTPLYLKKRAEVLPTGHRSTPLYHKSCGTASHPPSDADLSVVTRVDVYTDRLLVPGCLGCLIP